MFFDYIHLPSFIISLAIGLFFVYIIQPEKREVFVFPTPENIDKIQYKDVTDSCYRFTSQEVQCPKDLDKIENYIIQ
jgi:hypothetical protein